MSTAAEYTAIPSVDRTWFRPFLAWLAVVIGACSFVAAVAAAPLLIADGHPFAAGALYQAFSRVCHQIPARSFYIAGYPVAVCARCSGLYVGAAIGALAYPFFRPLKNIETPNRTVLFAAAAPTVIDFSLGFFGIWANTHTSRFLTASILGIVSAFYIVPGLVDLSGFLGRRSATSRVATPVSTSFTTTDETVLSSAASDYSSPERRI